MSDLLRPSQLSFRRKSHVISRNLVTIRFDFHIVSSSYLTLSLVSGLTHIHLVVMHIHPKQQANATSLALAVLPLNWTSWVLQVHHLRHLFRCVTVSHRRCPLRGSFSVLRRLIASDSTSLCHPWNGVLFQIDGGDRYGRILVVCRSRLVAVCSIREPRRLVGRVTKFTSAFEGCCDPCVRDATKHLPNRLTTAGGRLV